MPERGLQPRLAAPRRFMESILQRSMSRVAPDKLVYCALFVFVSAGGAEEWTRFRGPNGSGVSHDTGFPTEFGKDRNLLWRTTVRTGKSSPILTPRHIFLTGFEDGKLFTQCF